MNMVLFMLAGYETTSVKWFYLMKLLFIRIYCFQIKTTLSYCTYMLAKHPKEQIKLLEEINSFFSYDSDVYKF